MPPQLTAEIEVFRQRGQPISVVDDGARFFIILERFQLPDGMYVPQVTDLMVMADYQYPMSQLDMYWTDPPVQLTTGALPQGAESFEEYAGRRWQRWSWHYPGWNPSKHNLRTHIEVFYDRLAKGT